MRTRDAALYLGKSPGTLANWRVMGIGPRWTKAGNGPTGLVTYTEADLDLWRNGVTCPTCGHHRTNPRERAKW